MIISRFPSGNTKKLPSFSYTGVYSVVGGGDTWAIKFLTSGTLTLLSPRAIDLFLVGGGGGGVKNGRGGGGGGGYTDTYKGISAKRNTPYAIVVGAPAGCGVNGNASSAFGYTANGGLSGNAVDPRNGGAGGSGGGGGYQSGNAGAGGSDGNNGTNSYGAGGAGQRMTTREFGEASGTLYSGGGGGASGYTINYVGSGGGGGDGGGGGNSGGSGGSGIVIIRNKR